MNTMKTNLCLIILASLVILISETSGQCTPYLGQAVPTTIVKRFPPSGFLANQQWFWHGTPMFSPDGNEMYFVKYFKDDSGTEICFSKCENGQWTTPQKASFSIRSTTYSDNNPFFTSSNDTLYFRSNRNNGFIHYVVRTSNGWSSPQKLNIPVSTVSSTGFQFCIAGNKTVYFEIDDDTSSNWNTNIYSSKYENGQYSEPVKLGLGVNTDANEILGYIDPQEKFLIFSSNRAGSLGYHDLYLSKRNNDGSWDNAVSLGTKVNGTSEDVSAYISPDGKYFFYQTWKTGDLGYNPYWVSSKFIFDMVTDVNDESITAPNGYNLEQNHPNPFNPSTVINFSLANESKVILKVFGMLGNEIATLVDENKNVGIHQVNFDASGLAGGLYFYRLTSEYFTQTKKMLLLK